MIFMELRCEDSAEEYAGGKGSNLYPRCWSHDNSGMGVFTTGSAQGAASGWRELKSEAKSCGWVQMKHGWVCPFCVGERKRLNIPATTN